MNTHPAKAAVETARARFEARNTRSKALHEKALASLPGGNTRSILHTAPFPITLRSGCGHTVTSVDGDDYFDFVVEMTAGLFGHSHPLLISAIKSTLDTVGLNLGGTTEQEALFAAAICQRFGLERVRFTNSGTEANLHALNAAKSFTGKRKIIAFHGAYHGGVYNFASGRPADNVVDRQDFMLAPYNNVPGFEAVLDAHADETAAVILEPMLGAGGCIPGTDQFLRAVRELTRARGVLLVLDEVFTSRLSPGGLGVEHGIAPDLTTLGKWLGGGLAFGAFGGRADVMALYDPRSASALAHSGTFNNNSLAMHAGFVGLTQLYTPEACVKLNSAGSNFLEKLQETVRDGPGGVRWTGRGSVMSIHFYKPTTEESVDGRGIADEDEVWKELFWLEMLEKGFWISRRGQIVLAMGAPEQELDRFVRSLKAFIDKYKNELRAWEEDGK